MSRSAREELEALRAKGELTLALGHGDTIRVSRDAIYVYVGNVAVPLHPDQAARLYEVLGAWLKVRAKH